MRQLASILVFTIACGSSGSGGDDQPQPDSTVANDMRYNPWSTGAVWSYKLTDPGTGATAMNKLTTVMAPRDVGGVHAGTMAFLVHIEQLTGSKDVYETFAGELDVRYQSIFYDGTGQMTDTDVDQPYRLKLDESAAHTVAGAQWPETFSETSTPAGGAASTKSKTEQWRVVSPNEQITVIAGTYSALHVQRTSSGGAIQDYWYARGVGKLKETGGGQNEELMSFTPGS
jgi:hypothetical protein